MKILAIPALSMAATALAVVSYTVWKNSRRADTVSALALREVDNGDAQFWLMQGSLTIVIYLAQYTTTLIGR